MPELTSVSSGRLDDPASHIYAPDTGTAAQFDVLKYSSSVDETRSGAKLSSFNGHNYERLIDKIVKRADSGDRFFSLEFFPARTFDGAMNLISTFDYMKQSNPLFCDITWHPARDPTNTQNPTSSLCVAGVMVNYCGLETMLHLTGAQMTLVEIINSLHNAKRLGIRNILALRGDPPDGEESWKVSDRGINYGTEMVQLIRQEFGDYFVICVAGYPNGHPECDSYREGIIHLKEKVDSGADFIITQLFFDASSYLRFLKDCRSAGIMCPILPGVMPIQAYSSLRNIVRLTKLQVPQDIIDAITPIKDNDEAIRNYGIHKAVELIMELFDAKAFDDDLRVPGVHFYTINQQVATVKILKRLGMWVMDIPRMLPWKQTANAARCMEDVRPIFWRFRPNSYVSRTSYWDEFPNGRWGNSSAPSFNDLKSYHLFYLQPKLPKQLLLDMWGPSLCDERDVWHVFTSYLTSQLNRNGVKVTSLPWDDSELIAETMLISDKLASVNRRGVLTINSQPSVNCVASSDPVVGWGRPNGYVFQKAYLEFFISQHHVDGLKHVLPKHHLVNYHIVNSTGESDYTNCDHRQPIAVTWGVFPGKEIIQPTVVDHVSFLIWKDEAFALWKESWGELFPPDSRSRQVIDNIHDTYYLVNLVDNDFTRDNCLWQIIDEVLASGVCTE